MFNTYQEIFQERADRYHHAMSMCPDARREEFEAAINNLDLSDGSILCDVPAGGGYLADFVTADVNYLFLETSSYFAKSAQEAQSGWVTQSAIEQLPIGDGVLPRVLSLAAVHHVMDKKNVLQEFERVLTPGGLAVIADVEDGTGTAGFLNTFVDRFNSMGHDGRFLNDEFLKSVEDSELELVKLYKPSLQWHFANIDLMVEFCTCLFGLDLAEPAEVLSGIEQYLGYVTTDHGVSMNWWLSYFVMQKRPG